MAASESRFYFSILIFLLLFILEAEVYSLPIDSLEGGSLELVGESSWRTAATAILTIGSLVTLIVLLFACGGGGCCGLSKIHWFGRRREDGPTSFENPMSAEGGGTMLTPLSPMAQIDVRALELDPVVFEPLPTIHNLTPLTSQSSTLSSGSRDLGGFNHPKKPMVIPFATEDSELYAHDWFDEPHKNFPRSSIEYVREVGRGWFGQVIEAEAKDIVPFARKIRVLVKLLREDASGIEQMRFLDEARLYRDSNHANVVKLLGHSIEKLPFLLIMEKFPLGDLKSYLISNVTRAEVLSSQGTLVRMALDIAKGLEWMHSSDFIHTDLAARNCQVGSENRIIIGDYGLATKQYKDDYYWNTNVAIPLRWAAPETLHCTVDTIQTLKVSKHANLWTFAVLLWEITEFGKLPYFELNDEDVISRVIADQNYFLGPPTLPYIPAKEELYEIMSACWKINPQSRIDISSIVKKLDSLLATSCGNLTPSKDEFDTKWASLSSTPGSSNSSDVNRKKSVSFTGIISEQFSEKGRSIEQQRQETEVTFLGTTSLPNKTSKLDLSSPFLPPPSDSDDDNDTWEKNSHTRSVTQKILEKSPSVQDMMTLTHISASDLADTDSLPFISNSDCFQPNLPDPAVSHESTGTEFGQTKNTATGSSQNLGISLVEKNICDAETKLRIPDKHTGSSAPNGVMMNLIEATPDPKVEINLIHPTPSPGPSNVASTAVESHPPSQNPFKNSAKPVTFVFPDDTPKSLAPLNQVNGKLSTGSGRRHTSTPKKSASSPLIVEGYDEESPEEVFDPAPDSALDSTCNISPISEKLGRNGELLTTILVGASDDFGLDAYQSVTTQLEGIQPEYNPWNTTSSSSNGNTGKSNMWGTVDLDATDSEVNGVSNSNIQIQPTEGVTFNVNTTGRQPTPSPYNVTPMPPFNSEGKGNPLSVARKLFAEDNDSDKGSFSSISINTLDETLLGSTDSKAPSGMESALWSDIGHKDEKTISSTTSALFGGDNSSTLAPLDTSDTPKYELLQESTDDADFWSTQLQSVQDAASSTRLLFELSLEKDEEDKKAGEKFVEDIEAAQEELGSLVFQDLEDPSSMGEIVPESRDDTIENETRSKLAFLGFDNSTEENPLLESVDDSRTEVLSWDPSSIAAESSPTVQKIGENQPDLDFVPSKWDQSLAPVRPAIKSPGDITLSQPKSNLKKSVSFENKRTQLVYEYPPPPPISDSEEDERLLRAANKPTGIPIAASLDWDLTQEELEDAEIHNEDWEEEEIPKADRMDVYRISGFDNIEAEEFHVRGSNEPFVFQPTVLGELRHTRDKLRLDLSTGEASLLDDDSLKGAQRKLDSGVGSSTNDSPAPFNNCDMLPNRRNNNQDHE